MNGSKENENYWAQRWEKSQKQMPDLSIYSKLDIVQKGTLQKGENENLLSVKQIFKGVSFYFNGLTAEKYGLETSNLSQLHLSHLSTLHGATVLPHIAKKQLAHIICENACFSK